MSKRGRRNHDNNKNSPKREEKCNNCSKDGHWKIDCWNKGSGKEGQWPKKHSSGSHGRRNRNEHAKTAVETSTNAEHIFITTDFLLITADTNEIG
jgi:hypothetical protein